MGNISRWFFRAAVCALMPMVLMGQEASNLVTAEAHQDYVPGELLVKFKDVVSTQDATAILQSLGAQSVKEYKRLNLQKCSIDPSAGWEQVVQQLEANPNIEYAEPNYIVHILGTPNDPRFSDQWALNNTGQNGGIADADIDAPEAWDVLTGSRTVIVGIVDTGVDDGHPDLQANMWRNPGESGNGKESNGIDDDGNGFVDDYRGWDFINNDNNPFDDNRHGTHVAGIIGAVGNNGKGVSGANWNVSLVGLKFLSGQGSGSTSDAIEAILYAASMGFHILNNSWGGGGFSQSLGDAIEAANQAGILFVAAAGNDGSNNDSSPTYPSNYTNENVLAVASSDKRELLSSFSNYGKTTVDLAAPGSDILSTVPGSGYAELSGTSMATPYAVGVAALVKAQFPAIDHVSLKYRLMGGVDPRPAYNGKTVSGGRLNAANSLSTNPLIATVQHPHTSDASNPYRITAYIVDNDAVASAKLFYSLSGSASGSDSLDLTGANAEYTASIPAQPLETTVSYYVRATDSQGNISEGRHLSFQVTANPPGNGDGGGGCCGAFAVTIQTGNQQVDIMATLAVNLFLFFLIPVFILKRRK